MKNQFDQKVVLIVQARMGSARLPGKSMLNLSGQSLIQSKCYYFSMLLDNQLFYYV
tara:strand:- start:1367 stop:1534 length:168 start_codon:yes stop_codon:yes gene_type:complete